MLTWHSNMDEEFKQLLQDRLDMVKQKPLPYQYQELEKAWQDLRRSKPEDFDQSPETGVDMTQLEKVAKALVKVPEGFKPIKQIEKALKQRNEMFFKTKELNWAAAELLAYGSIVARRQNCATGRAGCGAWYFLAPPLLYCTMPKQTKPTIALTILKDQMSSSGCITRCFLNMVPWALSLVMPWPTRMHW